MKTRVISASVLIAVSLGCILLSSVSRVLFFAAAGILCVYEFSVSLERLNIHCRLWVMVVYLLMQAVFSLLHTGLFPYCASFVGCIFLALFSGVLRQRVSGNGALDTVAGLAYPCSLFTVLMIVSVSRIWFETIMIGTVCCWMCDAFALFGGMRFGRHPLAPAVSPKKTWEGAVCGEIAAAVTGVFLWALGLLCAEMPWLGSLYSPLPLWLCVVTAFLSSAVGQVGDLAESLIKRMIGVKDFSDLIPGHGGMFDRADSLLFAIPTAYFCIRLAQLII